MYPEINSEKDADQCPEKSEPTSTSQYLIDRCFKELLQSNNAFMHSICIVKILINSNEQLLTA